MTRIRLIAAFAAFAAASPASAADFTFDVPVSVQNLPSMHTLWRNCTIYTAYPGGRIIGRAESRSIPTIGGSYEGTVTIEVNASGITPASEARAYACSLRGNGTARTGSTYAASPDNFAEVYPTATGHSLSRANNTVRGPLP